jgi:60 kDa SS-A/Ro ribonucleoprotein
VSYDKLYSEKITPQYEPIPGSTQIKNNAGGYVYGITDWQRLDRFLILGSEAGSYYVSAKEMTKDNVESVKRCVKANGREVIRRLVEISEAGRAAKNEPALFVLAMCTAADDKEVRKEAWAVMPKVARTGTHLFQFVKYREIFGGWGRLAREGISAWYTGKSPDKLAYQLLKYQQRDGVSHRDILRLAHTSGPLKNSLRDLSAIFSAITHPDGGEVKNNRTKIGVNKQTTQPGLQFLVDEKRLPSVFEGVMLAKQATSSGEVGDLILRYGLTREMIPTKWLDDPVVFNALFQDMPMTAMVRNLGQMSKIGLLTPMSNVSKEVVRRLTDVEIIRKSRLHPLNLLVARKTYGQGRGVKGNGEWTTVPQVVDALEEAMTLSFDFVEPTRKNYVFGVDVSSSMESAMTMNGMVSAAEAATVMALVCVKTEPNYFVGGFSDRFKNLNISARDTYESALGKTTRQNFGSTDCAVPILHAMNNKIDADVFVVLTDNETWCGNVHPVQALKQYRQQTGRNAKMVVVAMTASKFSIADPNDAGMLDVVGMDTSVPSVIAGFVRE